MSTVKPITNAILKGIMTDAIVQRDACTTVNTDVAGVHLVNESTQDLPAAFPTPHYGFLIVFAYGGTRLQLLFNYAGTCMLVRTKWDGQYYPWRTITIN